VTSAEYDAVRRDIKALRADLLAESEEQARKLLAAHVRTLRMLAEHEDLQAMREDEAKAFRVDMRAWMARNENRTLEILQGVPHPARVSDSEVPPGRFAAMAYRMRRRLDGPVTLRALVYGLAVAGLAASATSCALYFAQ
jgi:hypothetical protein